MIWKGLNRQHICFSFKNCTHVALTKQCKCATEQNKQNNPVVAIGRKPFLIVFDGNWHIVHIPMFVQVLELIKSSFLKFLTGNSLQRMLDNEKRCVSKQNLKVASEAHFWSLRIEVHFLPHSGSYAGLAHNLHCLKILFANHCQHKLS